MHCNKAIYSHKSTLEIVQCTTIVVNSVYVTSLLLFLDRHLGQSMSHIKEVASSSQWSIKALKLPTNIREVASSSQWSTKALTHPTNNREVEVTKAECCVALRRLCLGRKVAIENTKKTTAYGQSFVSPKHH